MADAAIDIGEPNQDELMMAMCAIRYTIGRPSYIVADGQKWARKYGAISPWLRGIVIRDLMEAVDQEDRGFKGALGMEMDSRGWRAVLAEMQALQKPVQTA